MKIVVCMKQVPAANSARIDPETGAMERSSVAARTNPYDLFALETALRLREQLGGKVIALTMGPTTAETMMKDAYAMGADDAYILSDGQFAGADVLATAFTLAQGIALLGGADLILCGRQTTDGDTAQVGPALAEVLDLPHAAWVSEIVGADQAAIRVKQDLASVTQVSELAYPCLITVDQNVNVPRLPSYRLKTQTRDRPVQILTYADLPEQDPSRYGLLGSATKVVRMFSPDQAPRRVLIQGANGEEKARAVFDELTRNKIL